MSHRQFEKTEYLLVRVGDHAVGVVILFEAVVLVEVGLEISEDLVVDGQIHEVPEDFLELGELQNGVVGSEVVDLENHSYVTDIGRLDQRKVDGESESVLVGVVQNPLDVFGIFLLHQN